MRGPPVDRGPTNERIATTPPRCELTAVAGETGVGSVTRLGQ